VLFQRLSAGKSGSIRLQHATQECDDYTKLSFCNPDIKGLPEAGRFAVKIRLDHLLLQRGLVSTRSKAQDLIRRGAVRVGSVKVLKTGLLVADDAPLQVTETASYVSRSALKLKPALDAFSFSPQDRICLDAGASTGGFTQVLLERGAALVFAVDVGRDQLHASLRGNPKAVSLESTDVRTLTPGAFPAPIQAIVCDLSFISLLKVLPAILPLAEAGAWLVALIKPQFEAGREAVGKGGIVKDEAAKSRAISRVVAYIEEAGWTVCGTLPSPITGQDGNEETLVGAIRNV
jgi:23S rRNA (cytidine1920-2'-O)/16S rRNA (cytidine1409-2'-O)-methyltransferase